MTPDFLYQTHKKNMSEQSPILNSPYEEPKLHYATDVEDSLDYDDVREGRRIFTPDIQVIPTRQKDQTSVFEINELKEQYRGHLINRIRNEVGIWREQKYPNTTRVTRELLSFWFMNPDRSAVRKLFFAQREAIETGIWLNEVADKSNAGQHILSELKAAQKVESGDEHAQLPRIAFKMATGTGKTVVMGCLILYHYFNRQEYRNDTRFADYFLVIAPGITIKNRLSVLFVNKKATAIQDQGDYYKERDLVPRTMLHRLDNLNSRLIITNYHSFEPRALQGNKRSPFDGKLNAEGKKTEAKEDYSQVVKRVLGKFKKDSRLLVLNDEAHHCYLPRSKGKTKDNEESDENARAAVWFSGLVEISKRFKIGTVYDLTATPYYLQGSGYKAYSLFPWVVSDFGLIEAIESGLVKIPYLPEKDTTQELTMPVLRNLYEHVKEELPKKGQKRRKSDAKKAGKKVTEEPPRLPNLVKAALDQFYNHYKDYFEGLREMGEKAADIFTTPPVFIVVCNNTSVSKEVYKFIAGYEELDSDGNIERVIEGHYDMFSNYDPVTKAPKKKSPTLLIDSDALEDSDQVNEEFKKIFKSELEEFKRDYARLHGQGAADRITEAEILREVVNTVGKPGKLGAHIRCVVSVSMLTEGWDANTVTHIMGLRAFGSQLLCEQVAGRALRRMNYTLQGYDKDGNPTEDKRKIVLEKFPPEYAHIIGVPFKMFKGGVTDRPDPRDYRTVKAIPERQRDFEIIFPNVVSYRIHHPQNHIQYDFSSIENYEIDGSRYPIETTLASPISPHEEKMQVRTVLEKRDQELLYLITKELIKYHFSDEDGNPEFQLFGQLQHIVRKWYDDKVLLLNIDESKYKRLLYFDEPKKIVDHVARGINTHLNTTEHIRPVFNYYNKFGSTMYVNGNTSRDVYNTEKSHVNYVVMDSEWEGIAAKTLDELDQVECYVKNQFLGFSVPYLKDGQDKLYYPDFIAQCKKSDGGMLNLIIEVTGMSKDKAEKKWYVENRWLPAVNAVRDKYEMHEWAFIEIANDVRNIKNQLRDKINSL